MKVLERLGLKVEAAKQVGTLYHLTNIDGMEFILRDNKLRSGTHVGISFTRNKMLNHYEGHPSRLYFKLIIDGDKLSNNFKVEPFRYYARDKSVDFSNESEEVVHKSEIPNISKYIKGIAFIARNYENDEYWGLSMEEPDELLFRGNAKTFYNKDLKEMVKRIDKKFGLLVQIGSQIKKDNNWFKKKGLM